MGIVDRIMAGEATWVEIWEHKIADLTTMIERERNNVHPADKCKREYCKHGNSHFLKGMVDHLETLKREFTVIKAGITPKDIA